MTDFEKQRAKEKAEELVDKFYTNIYLQVGNTKNYYQVNESAKKCALIAVDEILNNDGFTENDIYLTEFWLQVKKEIEEM